ncbi:MAG TPA: PAS domain-containing protein, partial [Polyangiaceae bacterium]|nr:PAS domain-containing protein [Polyangiaceae bacterium]
MDAHEQTIRDLEQEVATLTSKAASADAESQNCKVAEDALRTSEIRYRRLFEAAKDGILILDADTGQIVDANPFVL